MGDHAARADDAAFANAHAGVDVRACAHPHAVANMHRLGPAGAGGALVRVDGVVAGVDAYARGQQHVVANGDAAAVQHHAVIVGVEVLADLDIATKFAAEGRLQVRAIAHFT